MMKIDQESVADLFDDNIDRRYPWIGLERKCALNPVLTKSDKIKNIGGKPSVSLHARRHALLFQRYLLRLTYNKHSRNATRVRPPGIPVCLKFNLSVCKSIKGYPDFCFSPSEHSLHFIKLFKVLCSSSVLFLTICNR